MVGIVARQSPKVLAIIVAYNDPQVLERCLDALDSQTSDVTGVLIVDNSQPTSASISSLGRRIESRTRILRTGANLGPAGGFAVGLATFQEEQEWTHAWLMDDDSYPHPEALHSLLSKAMSVRPGALIFPTALNEETGLTTNYPGWSHAPLLDRLAVRLGGLPRSELFWWIEDTEYLQHRLPRSGVLTAHAPEAQILYGQPRRTGKKASWKYYYEVRNTVWYRLHVQRARLRPLAKLSRSLFRLGGSAIADRENRRANAMMVGRGLRDGLSGRLGVTVTPPTEAHD